MPEHIHLSESEQIEILLGRARQMGSGSQERFDAIHKLRRLLRPSKDLPPVWRLYLRPASKKTQTHNDCWQLRRCDIPVPIGLGYKKDEETLARAKYGQKLDDYVKAHPDVFGIDSTVDGKVIPAVERSAAGALAWCLKNCLKVKIDDGAIGEVRDDQSPGSTELALRDALRFFEAAKIKDITPTSFSLMKLYFCKILSENWERTSISPVNRKCLDLNGAERKALLVYRALNIWGKTLGDGWEVPFAAPRPEKRARRDCLTRPQLARVLCCVIWGLEWDLTLNTWKTDPETGLRLVCPKWQRDAAPLRRAIPLLYHTMTRGGAAVDIGWCPSDVHGWIEVGPSVHMTTDEEKDPAWPGDWECVVFRLGLDAGPERKPAEPTSMLAAFSAMAERWRKMDLSLVGSHMVIRDVNGRRLSQRNIFDLWTQACRRAGVPVYGLHSLKHSGATDYYRGAGLTSSDVDYISSTTDDTISRYYIDRRRKPMHLNQQNRYAPRAVPRTAYLRGLKPMAITAWSAERLLDHTRKVGEMAEKCAARGTSPSAISRIRLSPKPVTLDRGIGHKAA